MLVVDSAKLTALLIERQQSPAELARLTKLGLSTVARWTREDSPAHIKSISKLARVLGADYKSIIKEDSL